MAKTARKMITQNELKDVLTKRLKLQNPMFRLERAGRKQSGSIVSETFEGWNDAERQKKIWSALDGEYGSDSVMLVGTLLAYTLAEWNVQLD